MQLNSAAVATKKIKARIAIPAMECAGRLCARDDRPFKEGGAGYGIGWAVYMHLGKCRSMGKTRKGAPFVRRCEPLAQVDALIV
eukprot:6837884-Pyramimonas_sp.AAC.1